MFGDTEIKDAVINKLDKWLSNPPDFDDVESAYKLRGKLQAKKAGLLRDIESIEDEILSKEENKPRSNETRIKKLTATKEHRDILTAIEMQLVEIENKCKWLEFQRAMFSAANFHTKIRMDI